MKRVPFRETETASPKLTGATREAPGGRYEDTQTPPGRPHIPERPLAPPRARPGRQASRAPSPPAGWGCGRRRARGRGRLGGRARGAAGRGAGRQSSAAGPGGQRRRRRRAAAGAAPRILAGRGRQEAGSAEVTQDGKGGWGVGAGPLDPEGEWRRPLARGADAATREEGAGRSRPWRWCLLSAFPDRSAPFPSPHCDLAPCPSPGSLLRDPLARALPPLFCLDWGGWGALP